jgi:hypothetical protein
MLGWMDLQMWSLQTRVLTAHKRQDPVCCSTHALMAPPVTQGPNSPGFYHLHRNLGNGRAFVYQPVLLWYACELSPLLHPSQ